MLIEIPDDILGGPDQLTRTGGHPPRIDVAADSKMVQVVIEQLNRRLRDLPHTVDLHHYDFTVMVPVLREDKTPVLWPSRDDPWLACYAVRGSNEGYYVHISHVPRVTGPNVTPTLLAVAKCENELIAMRLAAVAFLLLEA